MAASWWSSAPPSPSPEGTPSWSGMFRSSSSTSTYAAIPASSGLMSGFKKTLSEHGAVLSFAATRKPWRPQQKLEWFSATPPSGLYASVLFAPAIPSPTWTQVIWDQDYELLRISNCWVWAVLKNLPCFHCWRDIAPLCKENPLARSIITFWKRSPRWVNYRTQASWGRAIPPNP